MVLPTSQVCRVWFVEANISDSLFIHTDASDLVGTVRGSLKQGTASQEAIGGGQNPWDSKEWPWVFSGFKVSRALFHSGFAKKQHKFSLDGYFYGLGLAGGLTIRHWLYYGIAIARCPPKNDLGEFGPGMSNPWSQSYLVGGSHLWCDWTLHPGWSFESCGIYIKCSGIRWWRLLREGLQPEQNILLVIGKMLGKPLGWAPWSTPKKPYITWIFIGSQSPFEGVIWQKTSYKYAIPCH